MPACLIHIFSQEGCPGCEGAKILEAMQAQAEEPSALASLVDATTQAILNTTGMQLVEAGPQPQLHMWQENGMYDLDSIRYYHWICGRCNVECETEGVTPSPSDGLPCDPLLVDNDPSPLDLTLGGHDWIRVHMVSDNSSVFACRTCWAQTIDFNQPGIGPCPGPSVEQNPPTPQESFLFGGHDWERIGLLSGNIPLYRCRACGVQGTNTDPAYNAPLGACPGHEVTTPFTPMPLTGFTSAPKEHKWEKVKLIRCSTCGLEVSSEPHDGKSPNDMHPVCSGEPERRTGWERLLDEEEEPSV